MKRVMLLLLIMSSFKSFSQTNNSDCSNIDAQYAKEQKALEAKYIDDDKSKKITWSANGCDGGLNGICRAHHLACCKICGENYNKELANLESKYDVKKQLCAEREKKREEIAEAKREKQLNADAPASNTADNSSGKTLAGNNYITIGGTRTPLYVECKTENEMIYAVGHQVQFRRVELTDKPNPPYNIDISIYEFWTGSGKYWEMRILHNGRNYVVNGWGAQTGRNIYNGTILTDRKDAPYPDASAVIQFTVTCF